MNKKIILSLLTVGMLAVVASAGTWAYFQDTESTGVNKITAGTIDLSLDGAEAGVPGWVPITLNEVILYPGLTQSVQFPGAGIFNLGTVPGVLKCTCINEDGNDLAQYMTIKVDGQTVFDNGNPVEQTLKSDFTPNWTPYNPYIPTVEYIFHDNGNDQTATAQGKTFKFSLKFTLTTPPQ